MADLDAVWQVARHAAVDGQDPEDLVQETYLRAFVGFGSYRGGSTRAWLAAICLNVARSKARRRQRRPREVPGPALLGVLPWSRADGGEGAADVADVVIAGLDAEKVSRCLALLPAAGVHHAGGRGRVHRQGRPEAARERIKTSDRPTRH